MVENHYTKRKFKGNGYTKLASTNDKTLSNEHADSFVSASYKKIKLLNHELVMLHIQQTLTTTHQQQL